MDYKEENEDSLNTEEEETSTNDTDEENGEETMEELKERLKKAEEVAENQKIRAEKAEKATKKKPEAKVEKETPKNVDTTLTVKDSARLQQANIPVDDWDDVLDYAKFKGIEVSEALKSSVVKATLAEKTEARNTAKATNTGGGRKGTSKISDDKLLADADKGKLPESDDDIARLAKARIYNKEF